MTRRRRKYDASHHERIVKGVVDILWGSAWADHVEEHKCCRLSGLNICNVMPTPPPEAWAAAERILGHIEHANGWSWPCMFAAAARADGLKEPKSYDDLLVERFGECLMYMAMGSGTSWFDDHAEFSLAVPYCACTAEGDLRALADASCREIGNSR